ENNQAEQNETTMQVNQDQVNILLKEITNAFRDATLGAINDA
ncbi:10897_t:CDS:1, partial [Cetraspora pellucida]